MSTDDESDSGPDRQVFNPILATVKAFLAVGALLLIVLTCGVESSNSPARNATEKTTRAPSHKSNPPREMDRRRDGQPQPDQLEKGLWLTKVKSLLVVEPEKLDENHSPYLSWVKYKWPINQSEFIIAEFKNGRLDTWSRERIAQRSPTPNKAGYDLSNAIITKTDDGEETYLLNVVCSLKGGVLTITNMAPFDYTRTFIVGYSGSEKYHLTLGRLASGKSHRVSLSEFTLDGVRFMPFLRTFDRFVMKATRPDGKDAWELIRVTGLTLTED